MVIQHSKPNIKKDDLVGVLENLVSDNIADGETVKLFEKEFASRYKMRFNHAVILGSGTDALYFGLLAMGIGSGDEVILSTYQPTAVYHAVRNTGALPVLCDIGADFNLDPDCVRESITGNTRAVIITHLFGQPADIGAFQDLGVPLVEDCAQALGATYEGRQVGSFGKFAAFSFYASKMITTGHGGLFFSRDPRLASSVRGMRSYRDAEGLAVAFNSCITDFQAAMGLNQLKRLDHFIEIRRKIAEIYNKRFLQTHHGVPQVFQGRDNVFYRYPVRIRGSLKEAISFLHKQNIEACQPVLEPLHRLLELPGERFPDAEKAWMCTLSIPIYPAMANKEVEFVARAASRII